METDQSLSVQHLLSITDIIKNSPRAKIDCVRLHYMTLLIMDISITFNLFPVRIFTILGSQAKDLLGEELHFEIGLLEKDGKRGTTLQRSQKQVSKSLHHFLECCISKNRSLKLYLHMLYILFYTVYC